MQFEPVIGLEVHAQLNTETKIFCGCTTKFGAPPNANTCPVCLGLPGVLPVLNRKVAEKAVSLALATNCKVSHTSTFDRKNYFYPDLPKGYQITQYEFPVAEHGYLDIETGKGEKRIGITRIHLEEDAGKSSHDPIRPVSMVDLNRAGVPLTEIVSEPDLRTPEEAGAYLRKLHAIVRYIGVCDGNMEEGSFRCDANISVRPVGQEEFGTRTELKNLNSFKHVEKAIQFEINRQINLIENGGTVVQETRLWEPSANKTVSMRGKEDAHDYRYFPEPDLLPLIVSDEWVETARKELPELPDVKRARFEEEFALPPYDAGVITASRELADFFEAAASGVQNIKKLSNWIMGPLLGLLNAENMGVEGCRITAENFSSLIQLIEKDVINEKSAKTVFDEMAATGKAAKEIVEEKGLVQVTDTSAIESVIQGVIDNSPGEVAAYKNGKNKLFGFFVGQVMRESKGKANPKIVNEILRKLLDQ